MRKAAGMFLPAAMIAWSAIWPATPYAAAEQAPSPNRKPPKVRVVPKDDEISDNDVKRIVNALTNKKEADAQKTAEEERNAEIEQAKEEKYLKLLSERLDRVKTLFEKAEAAWKEKRFRQALDYYAVVIAAKAPGSEKMVTAARDRLVEAEKPAAAQLADAESAMDERRYVKALEIFKKIVAEFPRTTAAEKARRYFNSLRRRPETAGLVLLSEGELAESDGRWATAAEIYRQVLRDKRYAHSVTAIKARRRLNALLADEDKRGEIEVADRRRNRKEAERLWSTAQNYLRNGLKEKGREKLRELLKRFPDSKVAAEARKKLDARR